MTINEATSPTIIKRAVLPGMKTVNETNAREHWRKRQKRAKEQRQTACFAVQPRYPRELPVTVTLVRLGPRKLDDDNLAASMKHVRDGIADAFKVDDGSDLYTWVYKQEQNKSHGVVIEIKKRRVDPSGNE